VGDEKGYGGKEGLVGSPAPNKERLKSKPVQFFLRKSNWAGGDIRKAREFPFQSFYQKNLK